jgi:hypothetical protein
MKKITFKEKKECIKIRKEIAETLQEAIKNPEKTIKFINYQWEKFNKGYEKQKLENNQL